MACSYAELSATIVPKSAKPTDSASNVSADSVRLRHRAAQTKGKNFTLVAGGSDGVRTLEHDPRRYDVRFYFTRDARVLIRAIAAFIALPGVVAFAIPLWIGLAAGRSVRYLMAGGVLLSLGTFLLLLCVREFYVSGRGTLAPWDPPRQLVTSGPYRCSRNPMYVGVILILSGWCVFWGSRTLLIYEVLIMAGFHLRVLLFEEPWAAGRFGAEWDAYRARVPRWVI
jgi:protein-S-isoprenylcysteine O-methyltransferase Ste14